MATYFTEPSRTFSEYLLIPGYTDERCVPQNVNLRTPLVKYRKGRQVSLRHWAHPVRYCRNTSKIVIARSEATWDRREYPWVQSPGTIHRTAQQFEASYREIATSELRSSSQ